MRIKLATPLIGEFPRYADVKLPDNAAVTAASFAIDTTVSMDLIITGQLANAADSMTLNTLTLELS